MFANPSGDFAFDIESFPNLFTICFESIVTGCRWQFEVSDRKNHIQLLKIFISGLTNSRLVGYNNLSYDYPLLHFVLLAGVKTAADIYSKSQQIFKCKSPYGSMVRPKDVLIPQIDLYKIWHYDNAARSTSLKLLEFNMRKRSIDETTVPFDTFVPLERIDEVLQYNINDVTATVMFYWITRGSKDGTTVAIGSDDDKISFREELSEKYGKNMINFNDTKIGKEYFIMELEKVDRNSCYYYEGCERKINQTPRETIPFDHLLLPYISFEDEKFQAFFDKFKTTEVKETKGSLKGVSHTHKGFKFAFGTGGIHGSVGTKEAAELVEEDDEHMILDIDVKSFYPNLSIVNKFAPEHLGEKFCTIYAELFRQRDKVYNKEQYPTINLMLKLALNGVYGDSNSKYSPFYDPWMTMSITLNGQMLLCMLAEQLMKVGTMLQINTDGMTLKIPRNMHDHVLNVVKWWESLTGLQMEYAYYSKMLIRDVNNYLALKTNGEVKEKGAYETERDWHKNHSKLVVPKAVKEWFVNGTDIEETICNHEDVLDFCLRTYIKGNTDKMYHGDRQLGKVNRYVVSSSGEQLKKVMPSKGLEGQYKRKHKLRDEYYQQILDELREQWGENEVFECEKMVKKVMQPYHYIIVNGEKIETDSTGLPFDERINFKSRTKYEPTTEQTLHKGASTTLHNNLDTHPIKDICYNWYIQEAEKLVKGLIDEDDLEKVDE